MLADFSFSGAAGLTEQEPAQPSPISHSRQDPDYHDVFFTEGSCRHGLVNQRHQGPQQEGLQDGRGLQKF